MVKRCVIMLVLSPLILAGQKTDDSNSVYDEAAFRKSVEAGLPPEPNDRSIWFARSHEDVAIPILLAAIKAKAKLRDPETNFFVLTAIQLATYIPTEKAIDVSADLCEFDPSRFCPRVGGVLTSARGYQREFELAYYAIEAHPNLKEPVIEWFKQSLTPDATSDMPLARQLLKREKAGHLIRVDDPLLSSLPKEARDRIQRAIERARIEEGYQHLR